MFETSFSGAFRFIKFPKTLVCNSCQTMNDNEYDNVNFKQNEEV